VFDFYQTKTIKWPAERKINATSFNLRTLPCFSNQGLESSTILYQNIGF
jgi:hypothetical protein